MTARRKTIKKAVSAEKLAAIVSAAGKNALKSDKKSLSAVKRSVQAVLKSALELKKRPTMTNIDLGGITLSSGLVTVPAVVKVGDTDTLVTLKLTAE